VGDDQQRFGVFVGHTVGLARLFLQLYGPIPKNYSLQLSNPGADSLEISDVWRAAQGWWKDKSEEVLLVR
jgi:hypothetical protein